MLFKNSKGTLYFTKPKLITNFEEKELGTYLKALMLFQDDTLSISEFAYDIHNRRLNNCYSLNTSILKDRSDFWKLFDKVESRLI